MKLIIPFALLGLAGALGYSFETMGLSRGGLHARPAAADDGDAENGAPAAPAASASAGPVGGVHLTAELGQQKLLAHRPGPQALRVAVTADPREAAAERAPLDLVLVIDRSGSMGGDKMDSARDAAKAALSTLAAHDRGCVISFDDGAEVLAAPFSPADAPTRLRALAAIDALYARGGTDMVSGLEEAERQLLRLGDDGTGRVRRVVLLSDGRPNTEAGLAEIVRRMARRQAVTTTVGLGLDYNEDLMAKLADAGLGSYHFAERGSDLAGLFARELAAAQTVVARAAVLHLKPGPGVGITAVPGFELSRWGDEVLVPLGDLYAGRTLDVLATTLLPGLSLGEATPIEVRLDFVGVDEGVPLALEQSPRVAVIADEEAALASRVASVGLKAQEVQTAQAYLDANAAYNRGDVEAGDRIVQQQAAQLEAWSSAGSVGEQQRAAAQQESAALLEYAQKNKDGDRRVFNNSAKWKARVLQRSY